MMISPNGEIKGSFSLSLIHILDNCLVDITFIGRHVAHPGDLLADSVGGFVNTLFLDVPAINLPAESQCLSGTLHDQ